MDEKAQGELWQAARAMIVQFGEDVGPRLNRLCRAAFKSGNLHHFARLSDIRRMVASMLRDGGSLALQ